MEKDKKWALRVQQVGTAHKPIRTRKQNKTTKRRTKMCPVDGSTGRRQRIKGIAGRQGVEKGCICIVHMKCRDPERDFRIVSFLVNGGVLVDSSAQEFLPGMIVVCIAASLVLVKGP